MEVTASSSREQQQNGRGTGRLVVGLIVVSFLVFVVGSFVFAYLFLFSTPAQGGPDILPKIGGATLGSSPPSNEDARAAPTVADIGDRRFLNILLLGLDQRDDERGVPTRSDSMIVVSIDQANKRAAMISLPRDMWVQIPGYADNRINVANFLGDAYKYPGGGPALAKKTVEANFGLKIDYYARINFRGFEKVVDTLGGIDVNVEQPIIDNEYPTEDYGFMRVYIPAGRQHMNGTVALQYARSRHSENDFGRAHRQQVVLMAIKDRALQLDVIPKLPTLMNTFKDMVDTDMPPQEILRLAAMAKDIRDNSVSTLVIDDKLAPPFVGEGGADLLMPNRPEIRKAIAALLAGPVIKQEGAKIEVANGTTRSGLATRTGDFLLDQGFDVSKVSTADRADYKTTQILVVGDKKGTAALLAQMLKLDPRAIVYSSTPSAVPTPMAATKPTPVTKAGAGPDIRVILGTDFNLPQ